MRWWGLGRTNPLLGAAAIGSVALGVVVSPAAAVAAGAVAFGPVGLGLRGRTSPLAWTARLRTLAAVAALIAAALIGAERVGGWRPAAVTACLVAIAAAGGHRRRSRGDRAARTPAPRSVLRQAHAPPGVGATDGRRHHRLVRQDDHQGLRGPSAGGHHDAWSPTPRSFNNRTGLATAINEHLTPGTDVFVAEMGTYGPGEIAELCRGSPPTSR